MKTTEKDWDMSDVMGSDSKGSKKPKSFWGNVLDVVIWGISGLAIGLLVVFFVVQKSEVEGSSMMPNLVDGDTIIVEKVVKHFRSMNRGDIVVISVDKLQDKSLEYDLVKRVVGLPGETIEIRNGNVIIDGEKLDEPYLSEGTLTFPTVSGQRELIVTLGESEYFCLGDNRGNSYDSRGLGPIPHSYFIGRVVLRIFPFSSFGWVQ